MEVLHVEAAIQAFCQQVIAAALLGCGQPPVLTCQLLAQCCLEAQNGQQQQQQ